jgi:uncharacterized protein DUF6474
MAKNAIGVAKVLFPAVAPTVAPYVAQAMTAVRDRVDRYRARRLGVSVDELARFGGRGGALHARIVGADRALADLGERSPDDGAFVESGRARLGNLAAAVRAAERMPAARRKAAHRAVSAELDRVECELLRRLGV